MHVEATRMLTAWIQHPTYGVNVLLPAVERFRLDGTEDDEPPAVKVYSDVDDDVLQISGIEPPSLPAVVVVTDSAGKGTDIRQVYKAGHVYPLVAGFGYYADGNRPSRMREADYTLRAVARSLRWFNQGHLSNDFRSLNGVGIVRCTAIEIQPIGGAAGGSQLMAFLAADLTVLVKAP